MLLHFNLSYWHRCLNSTPVIMTVQFKVQMQSSTLFRLIIFTKKHFFFIHPGSNYSLSLSLLQLIIHELTDKCWELCMGKPSNRLDSRTEGCLSNCVERFLDTASFVVNRLEKTQLAVQGSQTSFD